ncbi:MAG: hypothetical protein NE328_23820 [Lentisphaeraceae bacterium]|nr:hypothetical protein [Lentisphaeraceae bacterium]
MFKDEIKKAQQKERKELIILSVLLSGPLVAILSMTYAGLIKPLPELESRGDFVMFSLLVIFLYIPLYLFAKRIGKVRLFPKCPKCETQITSNTSTIVLKSLKCPHCKKVIIKE